MSTPKNPAGPPPAGTTHRLHHNPILGGSHLGPQLDNEIDPELLKLVADYLNGRLPGGIVKINGRPEAAPKDQPVPLTVLTPEQEVTQLLPRISDGFLKTPETLPGAIEEELYLWLLMNGIDPTALRVNLPFNSAQVRLGGFALLGVCVRSQEAGPLKVNIPVLGQDLALCMRIRAIRAVVSRVDSILDANETQVLDRIAGYVDEALKNGLSTIKNNGELLRGLEAALAIRGKPVATGLESRGQNARTEAAIRADEQAKQAEEAGAARPATTTVTTEVPAPSPSTPKVPVSPGHKPGHKKGQ